MKKILMFLTVVVLAAAMYSQAALCQPGPVKINWMSRVETHSNISDGRLPSQPRTDFSGETYLYSMISATRELQKSVLGTVFYMNRFSFDDSEVISNIGGLNITQVFSPYALVSLGYSHTSNPQRAVTISPTKNDRDRFSASVVYTFNPKTENVKYTATTSFSTVTDFGEQQTLSEKLGASVPWSKKWSSEFDYSFSYSLKDNDQLSNQYGGDLTYKWSKNTRLSLGALFIDNVHASSDITGDDTIFRFTVKRALKSK